MPGTLPSYVKFGQMVQVVVDEGSQLSERGLVAATPGQWQLGNLLGRGGFHYFSLSRLNGYHDEHNLSQGNEKMVGGLC